MMTCSAAAIIAFLGYQPSKGEVVVVRRTHLDQYTIPQKAFARTCAALHGIRYRILEDKK